MSESNQKRSFRLEILEKLSSLITAGFGLVAALAWNEVILELFNTVFPKQNALLGKLIYAIIVTVIVVIVTVKIGNLIGKIKGRDSNNKDNA